MLSNTLNTNEIKNSAGTEQEFGRWSQGIRDTEFSLLTELPYLPHRLKIKHLETGSGISKVRQSLVRVDKTVISGVDSATPITYSAMTKIIYPVGAASTSAEMANVLANLMSFCASLGASTTILYDCTGNGAVTLIAGSL